MGFLLIMAFLFVIILFATKTVCFCFGLIYSFKIALGVYTVLLVVLMIIFAVAFIFDVINRSNKENNHDRL